MCCWDQRGDMYALLSLLQFLETGFNQGSDSSVVAKYVVVVLSPVALVWFVRCSPPPRPPPPPIFFL